MRHRSIKTTMDYYVNVDQAVMEAVLRPIPKRTLNTRSVADQTARASALRNASDFGTSSER